MVNLNVAAPAVSYSVFDLDNLTRTLLGEAANQGPEGQAAVGWTVRNRMADPRWGSTATEVTRQPEQFSAWNDPANGGNDLVRTPATDPTYLSAQEIARGVLEGTIEDPTGGRDHYFTGDQPYWFDEQAARAAPLQIGDHTFLGGAGGAGGASAQEQAMPQNPYMAQGLSGAALRPQQPAAPMFQPDERSGGRRIWDWMGSDGLLSGLVTGAGLMIGGNQALPMLGGYADYYGQAEQQRRMQQAMNMLPQIDPQTAGLVRAAMAAGNSDAAFKIAVDSLQQQSEPFTLGKDQVRFGPDGRPIARGPAASALDDAFELREGADGRFYRIPKAGGAAAAVEGMPSKPNSDGAAFTADKAAERMTQLLQRTPEANRAKIYGGALRRFDALGYDVAAFPPEYSPDVFAFLEGSYGDLESRAAPSEGERKAAVALVQARAAYDSLDELLAGGYEGPTYFDEFWQGASDSWLLPDALGQVQNDDTLRYRRAVETLANAVNRVESGATITDAETRAKLRAIQFNALDPPEVTRDKMRQLQEVMLAIESAAGRASPPGYEPAGSIGPKPVSEMTDEELQRERERIMGAQ